VLRALLCVVAVAGVGGCDDPSGDGADSVDMLSADPVQRGLFYVTARGCPQCHQSMDPGAGTLAGASEPRMGTMAYPANLTPDVDTGIGSWSDDLVMRAMRSGVDDEDAPLCPPMPHFDGTGGDGRAMNDDEATSIVAYLRSLPPVHHEVPESSCPPLKTPPEDAPPDMARPPRDLAVPPLDLATPPDLAPPPDLMPPPD
jgi:hypothetical protein